ncbi:MAG: hypothetical protein ACK58J_18400, partial [Planctomyces sp.]
MLYGYSGKLRVRFRTSAEHQRSPSLDSAPQAGDNAAEVDSTVRLRRHRMFALNKLHHDHGTVRT